jgi:Protein of unknown function (DUF1569)
MMKSIFSPADNQEFIARIDRLKPDSPAQWGKMNAAQVLAHMQMPLRVALGDLKLKRGLMAILIGGLAKKKLLSPQPFGKSLPTDPNFVIKGQRDFETEKQQLLELLQRALKGGTGVLTPDPHPFFGKMTPLEWDILQVKHLDHHLRQFGV